MRTCIEKKHEIVILKIKKTRRFFMYLFLIIVDFLEFVNDFYIKINLTTNHYYKLLWSSESIMGKYNIGFGIPIKFPSPGSHLVKVQYRIWNPHKKSKKKIIEIAPETTKLCFI